MDNVFYLDGYNLICSSIHETLLNGNIKLLKNDKEIDFVLATENNKITLSFFDSYQDGDYFKVIHDDNEYSVTPRFIFHTQKFDNSYCPDLTKLGSFYGRGSTTFRVWVPYAQDAKVVVNGEAYEMTFIGRGLYEITIEGDLAKAKYHYEIVRNNETLAFKDLFSYANAYDSDDSYVVDLEAFDKHNIELGPCNDPIIYELSVRDFSSDLNAPFVNRGKFLAFLEEGLTIDNKPIGVDYLASLGVSHIQLMPVNNFDLANANYSWGYNPLDFNSLYWGYVVGKDVYSPIEEFKALVNKLHEKGLRVNLDVVFNHIYKIANSTFEKMLPYYFFRYDLNGVPGDASYCGNELRTESKFLREYIKIICERLVRLYDVDGLRFDLAGIIDTDTTNYLYASLSNIKKDFMMYGEGWNMGSILFEEKRTSINNADKVKNFAFFNGEYRDGLKGSVFEKYTKGYLLGNKSYEELIKKGLSGSLINRKQSINYVECHDNHTFYDKACFFGFTKDITKKICKSALASVVLSCGIPFIHGGQEFLRTKQGKDNTYNSGDIINRIDWSLMTENIDAVNYLRMLIALRKKYNYFISNEEMTFSYYYDLLIASIGSIDIFINPTPYSYVYDNWITYKEVLIDEETKLNNVKVFDVPSYAIIVAEK